jgi:hypothetical protein
MLVRADNPGLLPAQQPTQVRANGTGFSPGTFGAASSAPAGNLVLSTDAGQSAVFALVDSGSIGGTLVAGRLGIHGTGGSMSLTGTLNESGGSSAARFADITRPVASTQQQHYRVNECVIASVSCVVQPTIQLTPPRRPDVVEFGVQRNRLNAADYVVPNVGDTEEE